MNMLRYSALVGSALCLLALPVRAEVWGIKSHDPASAPPVTLFHFDEQGGGLQTVGVIKLGGSQIDVDGLALNRAGVLYAFEVELAGTRSRLLHIDKATAAATAIGPYLAGRDIRGATFSSQGELITLDATNNQLLRIDPDTGLMLGTPVDLTDEGGPLDIANYTDIAQQADGAFLLGGSDGRTFYRLRLPGGLTEPVHTDNAAGPDGWTVTISGLAFSRYADPDLLFMYDVSIDDDIYTYRTDAGFARNALYRDIISGYNAGRGDLAAAPLGPVSLLERSATWLGLYDAGRETLPDRQGWHYTNDPAGPDPVLAGGILHQGPTGEDQHQYWKYSDPYLCFSAGHGSVVEWYLKVISSAYLDDIGNDRWRTGYAVWISDENGRLFEIGIAQNGVILSHANEAYHADSSAFVTFDTTDTFHHYRFLVEAGMGSLYIDDALIVFLATGAANEYPTNTVTFADQTNTAGSETLLSFIRYGAIRRPGDANNDGAVDLKDLAALANAWLMAGCSCQADCHNADFNQSGQVDLGDFVYLGAGWD
ncbi:MAG: hypothetical protein JW810_10420 [Sedimentisphaerales bacterium]|nr:hypothetical protein [Sedimentisphaerales bacterium]